MEDWMILLPLAWLQVAQYAYYIIVAALAVSSVIQAQKAKHAAQDALDKAKGLLYQFRATTSPRRLLYGRRRIGGLEAYVTSAGAKNEYMYYVLIWADGPNEAVEKLLFDGKEVPLDSSGNAEGNFEGLVSVRTKLGGTDNFTAITDFGVPLWTSSDMLLGINYSIIKLIYDDNKFPNGMPNISAVVRGRNDIYDERSSAEGYSENPVLCLNHYLTTSRTGPGIDYATRVAVDEFVEAANACDEDVALSISGTQKRYTYNDVVTLDSDPEVIIDGFKTAFSGVVVYTGGRWHYYAGVYVTPTFTITKSMLVGPVLLQTKISKINHINTVKGTYVAECNDWQPTSFLPVTNPAYVTADGGELLENIDYTSKNTVMESRRMAKIELMRQRLARSVQIQVNIEGMRAQPGLPVMFDFPELEFNNQPMLVMEYGMSINENRITISLSLREYGPEIFDWSPSEDDQENFCTGPNVLPPGPPPGFPGNPGGPGLHYGDLIPGVYPEDAGFTTECKYKGGTASMIAYREWTDADSCDHPLGISASVPPRFYYRKKFSAGFLLEVGGLGACDCGGGGYQRCYSIANGGSNTYDKVTGAHVQGASMYSEFGQNCTVVESSTTIGGIEEPLAGFAYGNGDTAWCNYAISKTLLKATSQIGFEGCRVCHDFSGTPGYCTQSGEITCTLLEEELEQDAIDRLVNASGGWDAIAYGDMTDCGTSIWEIRTSGRNFAIVAQRIKTTLTTATAFLAGWPYEVEYDIEQRTAGSSDPFVKVGVLTVTVYADSTGVGFTETDVPNERGKETKVTGGKLI